MLSWVPLSSWEYYDWSMQGLCGMLCVRSNWSRQNSHTARRQDWAWTVSTRRRRSLYPHKEQEQDRWTAACMAELLWDLLRTAVWPSEQTEKVCLLLSFASLVMCSLYVLWHCNWITFCLTTPERRVSWEVNNMQMGIHPVDCSILLGSGLGSHYFRTSLICWVGMLCGWRDSDLRQLPTSQHWHTEDTCQSCRLQLNADNTETIWFSSQSNLAKLNNLNCFVQDSSSKIQPASIIRDPGLCPDSELSVKQLDDCDMLLSSPPSLSDPSVNKWRFILSSRLSYPGSTTSTQHWLPVAGLPQSTIAALQRVQNAAVRLVF